MCEVPGARLSWSRVLFRFSHATVESWVHLLVTPLGREKWENFSKCSKAVCKPISGARIQMRVSALGCKPLSGTVGEYVPFPWKNRNIRLLLPQPFCIVQPSLWSVWSENPPSFLLIIKKPPIPNCFWYQAMSVKYHWFTTWLFLCQELALMLPYFISVMHRRVQSTYHHSHVFRWLA